MKATVPGVKPFASLFVKLILNLIILDMTMSLMKNRLNRYNNSTRLSTQIMLNIVLEARGGMTNKVKILRIRGKSRKVLVLGKRVSVSISSLVNSVPPPFGEEYPR